MNLPVEFQLRGYDYNFISKSYLNFFRGDNSRQDKLALAKKFLKFVRNINKNRAREELGEEFFICFEYFMGNFTELLSKQDFIHLETIEVLSAAIDKSQFVEDIISVDELKRRVKNLEITAAQEQAIDADWAEFEEEYAQVNSGDINKYLLTTGIYANESSGDAEGDEAAELQRQGATAHCVDLASRFRKHGRQAPSGWSRSQRSPGCLHQGHGGSCGFK